MRPVLMTLSLLGLAVFLVCAASSSGQVQFESQQLGGQAEANEASSLRSEFSRLLSGDTKYDATMHAPVVAALTKYHIWQVTWANVQSDIKTAPTTTKMDKVRSEFDIYLIDRMLAAEKNNDDAKKAVCKDLIQRFQEVLNLPFEHNRLAHVNACLMLPSLARSKNEQVAVYLGDMVKNSKHDLHRMYAMKGMAEFFPAREFTILDEGRKQFEEQKVRDLERVDMLMKVVEKNTKMDDPEELEGVRYVRREAIKSLARVGAPAIESYKGKLQGAAALTLMRVLADDGLAPPATLTDKIEAALGICQLTPAKNSTYDPDIGIYLVGKFLIEFGSAYQKDFPNAKVNGRSAHPWKFHGERLRAGLDLQFNNLNNVLSKSKDKASELRQTATPLFNATKIHAQVNDLNALEGFVEKHKPATTIVFKNLPPAQLKLP